MSGRHAFGLRRLPPAWQDNGLADVERVRGRVAAPRRAMSAYREAGARKQAPGSVPPVIGAHEDPLHANVTGTNIRATLIVPATVTRS